jgi:hypothetical protein
VGDGSPSPLTKQLTLRSISGYPILYSLTLHFTRKADSLHEFVVSAKGTLRPNGSVDIVPVGAEEAGDVTYDLTGWYDFATTQATDPGK